MKSPATVVKDLEDRLSLIERLLGTDPALADQRAIELLELAPGHPMALLFRGIARRLMNDPATAIAVLDPLCRSVKEAPLPHLQLGLALRETGDVSSAERSIRRAVDVKPDFSDAWLALADLLVAQGDGKAADDAFAAYIRIATRDPRLKVPADLLRENRTREAEALLRNQLAKQPNDVCAMYMLADVAQRHARLDNAEALLRRCLDLAPSYRLARHNYSIVLMRQEKPAEALREVEHLLSGAPSDADALNLKAAIHMRAADYEAAIAEFRQVLEMHPREPGGWSSLGHALRTVGRREECIEAYRRALTLAPDFGEAAWNLANLKTYRITDSELASMRAQLEKPGLPARDRVHFDFAVGKALEDRQAFKESFHFYEEGNRLHRQGIRYEPDTVTNHVKRSLSLFTSGFFTAREGYGAEPADPIFIVGMPRSGSTLAEQILASHSLVEGTMELPHMTDIVKRLAEKATEQRSTYPEVLENMAEDDFRDMGEAYIRRAGNQRKRKTPFFIDKMPNNFAHVGLIHLILPNAKIIDVRRHPLACGWSLFRHRFATGQPFSYSLQDIGRYYRDYVTLMAHFDAVLPGRVHRVTYESLVDDTETEIRRLLAYCGLPFEEACLNWFDNSRAVSTPSSEQVRTPIFRSGVDHWLNFEPWLDPLKAELGAIVDRYPAVSTIS